MISWREYKKILVGLAVVLVLISLLLFASRQPKEQVLVNLPQGVSAAQAANILKENGVITSKLVFRAAAKLTGVDRHIEAGVYQLERHMWLFSLLRILDEGSTRGIKVVIPEGFSARQIAERLEALGICPAIDFENYVATRNLEGSLFPSVYYFDPNTPPAKIAQKMEDEFFRVIGAAYQKANPKPYLNFRQAVILASIIQREAVLDKERPMISAVYLNRLKLRMKLEADPTVQYALGKWKKELTKRDLKIDSPYNTYLYYGLPPGPICSFGLSSFLAALNPAQTDALYFVSDGEGGHRFAATNEEHMRNKELFKETVRRNKEKQAAGFSH